MNRTRCQWVFPPAQRSCNHRGWPGLPHYGHKRELLKCGCAAAPGSRLLPKAISCHFRRCHFAWCLVFSAWHPKGVETRCLSGTRVSPGGGHAVSRGIVPACPAVLLQERQGRAVSLHRDASGGQNPDSAEGWQYLMWLISYPNSYYTKEQYCIFKRHAGKCRERVLWIKYNVMMWWT